MRRIAILLLCTSLCACAANPLLQADKGTPAYDEKIAADTANQLARLYPPARTQFNFVTSTPVSFGALLAGKLRAKGYAVLESKSADKAGIGKILPGDVFGAVFSPKTATADTIPAQPLPDNTGIELRYVLDHSATADFSRITVKLGRGVLARAYLADNGTIAPAGAWTFKE